MGVGQETATPPQAEAKQVSHAAAMSAAAELAVV